MSICQLLAGFLQFFHYFWYTFHKQYVSPFSYVGFLNAGLLVVDFFFITILVFC